MKEFPYRTSDRLPRAVGKTPEPHVTVVVLGDLGRSPRMVYHARALAEAGARVTLAGYRETDLDPAVTSHPAIRVHALQPPMTGVARALFLPHALLRVLRQTGELLRLLLRDRADTILVQNPPAIPTFLVALAAARRGRLVIDWHNFGWAMLALRLGRHHPAVRLARAWEYVLGRRADAHLCVSRAMAAKMEADAAIHATVLYDRPADRFVPATPAARAAVQGRLAIEFGLDRPPALVVAPSSWTADEDMGLLVDAAEQLDAAVAADDSAFPDVAIVATGRGPLRAQWEQRAAALCLRRVHLRARWVPAAEYPAFLAAADVGVSLHRSASGVDLPMKIADLLGVGVPVCALAYGPCLAEMLRDGETGLLFRTADELAGQLLRLLRGRETAERPLAALRRSVAAAPGERWDDAWRRTARAVLLP